MNNKDTFVILSNTISSGFFFYVLHLFNSFPTETKQCSWSTVSKKERTTVKTGDFSRRPEHQDTMG